MTDESEKVGYKHPPKATQFKPGHTGNPRGRPKAKRNLRTDLTEELSETIRVREGGREYAVTKQRAVLKAVVAAAVKGDVRAATALINLCARLVGVGPTEDQDGDDKMSAGDETLLEDFLTREIARRNGPATGMTDDDK